jgi:prepilin-type N-terminal cleavage/methylation domain-containing protein
MERRQGGFTLVELMVSLVVLSVLSLGFFDLLTSLLHSAIVSGRQAVALTLATNQMEYLKSLPYDNLAVSGGAIASSYTIPPTLLKTVNGTKYTVTTSIVYADDAYDGCGSYPTQALKQQYCRNYPSPAGAPTTDTNPADYKDVNVTVTDAAGNQLSELDTDISARVAETASNTGALFVKVIDDSGNPVSGASVQAVNNSLSPAVSVSDTTDQNGIVIFYDLPPDTGGYDYVVTASETGYSTLTTIAPSGSLQPTYPSQKLIAQNSSIVTMTIKPQGQNSVLVETTDTNGNPLPNAKIYTKGGYKKYTSSSDTSYYYDNMTPSDTRPTTDASGMVGLSNLVPGGYYFCGDAGATSCAVGSATYYLAAAVPYGGTTPFDPLAIPTYTASSPPTTTYSYGGVSYLQKVRLLLTTSSTFPRISTISPGDASLASNLSNFSFVVMGTNLPCSSTASSCSTKVTILQGTASYVASCTGTSSGVQLTCNVNLAAAKTGNTQLQLIANGYTFTLPASPLLGGILVTP